MSIAERLKSERKRLGYSQTDFAAIGGASKGSQISWEKGAATPNAAFLAAVAEKGADILYIVTGRREGEVQNIELSWDIVRRAIFELQTWQVRNQRFIDPHKFVESVAAISDFVGGDPGQVKPATDRVLRLVA